MLKSLALKLPKVCGLLLCLLGLFAGCQKKDSFPKQEQVLRLNIPSDPETLDPRKGGDRTSSIFHCILFDGLMRLDDEGNAVQSLAEKVDISKDRTVYTFTIRDSSWSDGSPVTAWDFEKSWKDVLDPNFPAKNAHLLYPIKNAEGAKTGISSLSEVGIRSLNAKTLEVTLERPTPYFLDLVAFCVLYPVNVEVDHSRPNWEYEVGSKFVSNGPFRLKEWKRNNTIVLEKNPHYYRADQVILDEVHFSMVNSEMTAFNLFEKGELDILGNPLIPLPSDAIPQLMQERKLQVYPTGATTFCVFNVNQPPFDNANIRKAFSYAIERKEIVSNITQLGEEAALGAVPPVLKKYENTAFYEDGNWTAARTHFAKGLKEMRITKEQFPTLTFYYHTAELQHKVAQALQEQWKSCLGVKVNLVNLEKKVLVHNLNLGNYSFALHLWIAQYKDPMNLLERFKFPENVKNYSNWKSPQYAQLLTESSEAITNKERYALLQQAESLLMDAMPIAPIYHWNAAFITQPHVKSYGMGSLGNGFYDRIYIEPKLNLPYEQELTKR